MTNKEWLANLPDYNCPTCGNKTIFKNGCSDCEQEVVDLEDLASLPKEIQEIEQQIAELKMERAKKMGEYEALKRKLNKI
jgi:DNA-directed RNA polymerase subunit RPC12/RpoP